MSAFAAFIGQGWLPIPYRSALNLIHAKADSLPITPDLMRRLHKLCQEGSGDAGQFKKVDNEVIELRPGAAPIIRFKCVG